MWTLILTVMVNASNSSISVPKFETQALCETAAKTHTSNVAGGGIGYSRTVVTSCVKTSEK